MRDASAAEPPTEAAFRAACVSARAATGDDLATDERFTALHQVLFASDAPPPPATLLRAVRSALAQQADGAEAEAALDQLAEEAGAADSRLWSVLSYRVSRRRQLALAEAVLEQLVPAQPGS